MPQKFSRHYRLLKQFEFKQVFNQPIKSSDAWFTVLAKPSKTLSAPSRLGLAIARRQLKRAVDRNRIKRLVREHFRLSVLPRPCSIDYVVMVKVRAKNQPNKNLRNSLNQHFLNIQKHVGT